MNGISPWAAAASNTFADENLSAVYTKQCGEFKFTAHLINDSLWILATWPKGGKLAFRTAYSPEGELHIKKQQETTGGVSFALDSVMGAFEVIVTFPESENDILRYTTSLKPSTDLLIPFWPRDIIIPGKDGNTENTAGNIQTSQVGTRSGLIYFHITRPKAGSVMYFQNLTALNDYFEQTETSGAELVRGEWPELGLALPAATKKPLAAGKKIIISDAFVSLSTEVPKNETAMVRQYLDMLATLYLQLPLPQTQYNDWPTITEKGLKDLTENPGCWTQVAGHPYLNAYLCDYKTPPEIMVQLAVLLPLIDFVEWNKGEIDLIEKIKAGLPPFYNDDLKVIMRWHPKAEGQLENEEEQLQPRTMDSWYLHHPLMNLARLAHKGDKEARKLFLDSLDYAINVAHKFKYNWPVFYNMETLEVLKAETEPGEGGEKDVAGIYALVMLEAYELTGEKRYLNEAEKAAKTLQGMGFDLFYQGNNTTFSAKALLRLYKITENQLYLDLSYLCLANVFNNVQLWDCNYGYGKNFSTFFAVFPLSNAPYTAAYEEAEIFCALHDYLRLAEDVDLLPSIKLLIAEFIRFLVYRAVYYYPPMLPKEMLSEEVKTGELDPNLWIVLEDMNDGWQKCGQVGQEVYGSGNAFGILPRQFMIVPDEDFMIYVDYPTQDFTAKKGKPITFTIKGDRRLTCRMMIVSNGKTKLPNFTVTAKEKKQEIKGIKTKGGNLEYIVNGDQKININW